MKPLAVFIAFFLLTIGSLAAQDGWRKGEMEIMVFPESPEQSRLIKTLGIYGEPASSDGRSVRLYATPVEYDKLLKEGIRADVLIPDLNEFSRNLREGDALLGYFNYTTIVALADSLATAFPSICKKFLLGTTQQGRQLGILKISDNVNVNEAEPEIMFQGGIHGDEIMGPEVVIRYARDLCIGYGTNPTYTDLINTREIWLYYLVNPDGYVAVSRYNSNGVDINRDGGYMWDAEGFSTAPCSQVETKMIRNLQLDHNFVVFTDFHGGTEVISYPWSYKGNPAADVAHINILAQAYSNSSGYSNLGYGQGYNIMYQIFGSTKDNQYGDVGQVGWSIEITALKQPPSTQIGMYYGYNAPAMTEMITRSGWGIEGVVTDSLTGTPVKATIWVDGFFPVYTDPSNGDYHKYVLPGSHTVKVKASGYQTKTIANVTVPSQGSTVVNVQLTPAAQRYAYRVIATQIPSYPSSGSYLDESYTPGIIGAPDSVNYSIGRYGWIIIDMGDTLSNGPGNDFTVWETDGSPETFYCWISQTMDGPWTSIGQGTGTTSFDLSNTSLNKARYIKIEDDGDGQSNAANAGFDIDAVEFITPPLIADFIASTNTPCPGNSVSFTDISTGNPTSWSWTFPGGTPSNSAQQNPQNIVYNNPGLYDVSLTVTNTLSINTVTKIGFINVPSLPSAPTTPSGPAQVCQGGTDEYTTTANLTAIQYIWDLYPESAGSVSGAWTTCTIGWNQNYEGTAFLKVKEVNACGEGPFSDSLEITVNPSPDVDLGSDTAVCIPDSVNIDAGNPGCTYLWSTGETTQLITVSSDSSQTIPYWVEVRNEIDCVARDTIEITYIVCTAINDHQSVDIKVTPNPSRETFLIRVGPGMTDGTFIVTNLSGVEIMNGRYTGENFQVDLAAAPEGMYILRIRSGNWLAATKLLICR